MERWENMRGFLLAATGLCITLVAASSIGYGSPAPKAAASGLERPVTVLDPFTLRMVAISNPGPEVKAAAPSVSFVRLGRRDPVRIPVRPPLRSPFRPDL